MLSFNICNRFRQLFEKHIEKPKQKTFAAIFVDYDGKRKLLNGSQHTRKTIAKLARLGRQVNS